MIAKHLIIAAVASFAAIASVGTASATGRYYEGIDSHASHRATSFVQQAGKSASTNTSAKAAN
ncbi:hypothetical protein [Rhizobiales bacterium]|uniref:hypothetical protein n=1 Tax=Ensifer sp. R-19 TaxID=3404055 RepID=UPI000DD84CFD